MPRIVDLPDPDSSYAFRLRRVNQLGEPGEWSPETIVDTNVPSPTIAPVEVLRQGQVLGGVEMYIPGITLKAGQTARLGFNMFGTDGLLDNSLINRRDVTALWRASDGDLSDDRGRVVSYTAPDREGVYKLSVVVKQTVPGGIVQRDLEMVAHVIGSNRLVKPFQHSDQVPRNFEANGVTYGAISYFQAKEYRPPEASKALFKVREGSIPSYEWIGVHIAPGEAASASLSTTILEGYTAIGDVFTSQFVSKDGAPIVNMSFTSSAAICLPVPAEWTDQLQSLMVMRITPDDTLAMMNLPVRFQPNPTFNDPALVCGHSEVFDGQIFLGIANEDIATPTPTPTPVPTDTPTPIPTIEPTAIPTDTPTPTPTPDTSSVVAISTSTPTPTPVPPTPTSTSTPEPTATHTPVPTATSTPTPTPEPTATIIPTEVPTSTPVPKDTPAPVVKAEPTATATTTQTPVPTATAAPTETPTSTPEPTHTPVPTVAPPTPRPTAEPEPPSDDAVTPPSIDDEEDAVSISLIVIAVIAFLVLGGAIVSYIIYNNRVRRKLESAPAPDETPAGVSDGETELDGDGDSENDDKNGDDESPYDTLRYGR